MSSIRNHIASIMRGHLTNRTADRGTRSRFECVPRAATSGGCTHIVACPTYGGR
jgi:hypothetical protein